MERDKIIIRTSIIGILANVLLSAFKAVVGLLSGSIAIVLDAVNNISDAASSVITIVGTKLAKKSPDKKHPFGYGRIEYMSAMIISAIVLYAGITSFIESVKKIISPETPSYSAPTLIIVAVGVIAKIILGRYVKKTGEKVNSDSLVNSGEDAVLDSVISFSTLISAAIFIIFGLKTEAWLGAIISVVIIKSGIEMLSETISRILGERADGKFTKEIKNTVTSFPNVEGAYDLVLHSYGPDSFLASVHIEVPDRLSASEIDELTRNIQKEVLSRHGVIMTAIGIYAKNTKNDESAEIYEKIRSFAMSCEYVMQIHGFYLEKEEKRMTFDLVIDFAAPDRGKVYGDVLDGVKAMFPDYDITIAMDSDVSD